MKRAMMIIAAWAGIGGIAFGDLYLNVDFQPGGSGGGTSVTFGAQGAMVTPGNIWNTAAPSTDGSWNGEFGSGGPFDFAGGSYVLGSLLDSDGAATGVQLELFKGNPDAAFALNPLNGGDAGIAGNAKDLMRDFLIAGDPNDLNITGLLDGGLYTLYLYGAGDNANQRTTFTVGGVSQSTTGVTGPHDLTEGVDFVVFENVLASGGFIGINYTLAGGASEGHFNGFQLMEIVPEPSSALLVGLGGLLAACRRRRRSGV
jgi:hypothetical protein